MKIICQNDTNDYEHKIIIPVVAERLITSVLLTHMLARVVFKPVVDNSTAPCKRVIKYLNPTTVRVFNALNIFKSILRLRLKTRGVPGTTSNDDGNENKVLCYSKSGV